MKVICDRAALLDAVRLVAPVASGRSPKPHYACVHLAARKPKAGGELTLSATDGEMAVRLTTSSVDIAIPGEGLIPADKLLQIVSAEDTEQTLTFEFEKEVCHIRGEDAHFQLLGYPASEFPPAPDFDQVVAGTSPLGKAKTVFTQPAGSLASMIQRTIFSTARENTRYAINGVLFKRDGKKIEMVATDGRRLALCRGTLPGGDKAAGAIACIVPTKVLAMLQKLLVDGDENVTVAVTDAQVLFALGGDANGSGARAVLASSLVEGSFPPYEDVIPKEFDKKVVADRDVLSSAVRRAALLTNEESRGVRLKFDAAERSVELSSRAPEMGEATVNAPLNSYDGDSLEIGFNPAFLTDALRVVQEPQVIMEFKGPNKPGVLRAGTEFLYVVMPVSLQ